MENKIVKRLLLIVILIPIIIVILFYSWLLYEGSKLDHYTFTEEMKKELMQAFRIEESDSFNPMEIRYIDEYGPSYYNAYELKFEISKEDYEKNDLSYGDKNLYNSQTDASMCEEKGKKYICFVKVTKVVNEEKYLIFEKIYREQRHIPLDSNNFGTVPESQVTTDAVNKIVNEPLAMNDFIATFDKAVEELDQNYFVTDFENYELKSKIKKLKDEEISEIAQIGFEESAKRIAGEGAENKDSETIEIEEIIPNNYFTRKYRESDEIYKDLKMTAYVVTRENDIGNGIKIYIDMATGLIVGGEAFGD